MSIAPDAEADADIVAQLRQGHFRDAFVLILPRYRERLFRLAFTLLRDRAQAEDATQDAFIRIWQALPRFDGRSALGTWIYAIARNGCLSELRRRRPGIGIDAAPEDTRDALECEIAGADANAPDAPSGAFGGPAGSGGSAADAELDVLKLVGQLPDRYRRVITLFYLEDQSHEQTAAALGMSTASVKVTLHRARHKLAELAGVERAQSRAVPTPSSTDTGR